MVYYLVFRWETKEYTALKTALIKAINLKAKAVDLYLDSELVVKQINGEYKVKNKGLKPLYVAVKDLLKNFESYTINHIPREMNKEADRLANSGIRDYLSNKSWFVFKLMLLYILTFSPRTEKISLYSL